MMKKRKQPNTINAIAKQYGLRLVVLFGSQARGDTHGKSDADIAVLGHRPLDITDLARLDLPLQPLFPGRRLDIVDIMTASPLLQRQIFLYGKALFEGEQRLFAERQIYADMRYIEAKPLFDYEREYLKKRIASYG